MATSGPLSLQEKLSAALKRDPRKATILAVLVAVLLGMWGKSLLTGGRGTPQSAAAMAPAPIRVSPADAPKTRTKSTDALSLLHAWLEEPLPGNISRNLFELKLDYFPMDGSHVNSNSRTEGDPNFWDQLAKSVDAQADQQHKREILIQNLRQQAGQLQLTSTVMGPRPKAMINGVMVGVGEVVAEFRVIKIDARFVDIEREGITLEITMK